jgi:NAD(P)-dependent dehydrogenase (short-subunit alcohol dehydrogenase family)
MDLGLEGKAALVTGASRGLGEAIAHELANQGVQVCLAARDETKLAEVAAAITARTQAHCVSFAGDLRQAETIDAAVSAAVAAFGRLDILVNNAGATKRGDFFALTEDDWQDGYALKFHGYVRATRAAWPHLKAVGGSVINIVGIGAHAGTDEFTIGGSVNAALLHFTKAMSHLGIREGVRVNAINPGHIETERLTPQYRAPGASAGHHNGCCPRRAARRVRHDAVRPSRERSPRPWRSWPRIGRASCRGR